MRDIIRRWLGFDELRRGIKFVRDDITLVLNTQEQIKQQIGAIGPGLGRIIAKLDPMYAISEHDSTRKAQSDELGQAVLKRLHAENMARLNAKGQD